MTKHENYGLAWTAKKPDWTAQVFSTKTTLWSLGGETIVGEWASQAFASAAGSSAAQKYIEEIGAAGKSLPPEIATTAHIYRSIGWHSWPVPVAMAAPYWECRFRWYSRQSSSPYKDVIRCGHGFQAPSSARRLIKKSVSHHAYTLVARMQRQKILKLQMKVLWVTLVQQWAMQLGLHKRTRRRS